MLALTERTKERRMFGAFIRNFIDHETLRLMTEITVTTKKGKKPLGKTSVAGNRWTQCIAERYQWETITRPIFKEWCAT